jgi:hypothetical protein
LTLFRNLPDSYVEIYFGELPAIPKEYPRDYEYKDRTVLLSQFQWIHNFVLNEQEDKKNSK